MKKDEPNLSSCILKGVLIFYNLSPKLLIMRISKPALPFRSLILFALFVVLSLSAKADRIYIMNADGYNTMNASIENSITDLGHTVDVQTTGLTSLPTGFTTTCIDPLNGYDWLAFFGNFNFESLIPEIQQFIDDGGKVFYQYEVSCCTIASQSAADVASGLTGLSITPNSNSYIALGTVPAWEAADISCCMTFQGNAYKGLDGLPEENQMQATANLNGSSPSIANSLNFGFYFATDDFILNCLTVPSHNLGNKMWTIMTTKTTLICHC